MMSKVCKHKTLEYAADEKGNIYSLKRGKVTKMTPFPNGNGYLKFHAYNNGKRIPKLVHRFVWECFNGEIPKGHEIDHKNFQTTDNSIDNLRPLLPIENVNSYQKSLARFGNVAEWQAAYK